MEVQCKLCDHFVKVEEYDNHYSRCSSIKYIQNKMKELYNQDISYSDLYKLSKMEFNKKYFWLLNRVYEKTEENSTERKRLENILYGADYGLKECI